MERWVGRVALVTGASSGIGAAISKALVQAGVIVVGAAREVDRIQKLASELSSCKGSLMAVKCDLTKDDDIYALFTTIKNTYKGIDICINNAGFTSNKSLLDGTPEQWRGVMDVNVIALCVCTKLAVASMRGRGIDDGHIINVSSMSGHRVPTKSPSHFYSATKFAVRAINEGLRQELREAKSHIRVSSISPGMVSTEFNERMDNDFERAKKFYSSIVPLQAANIAVCVLHIISAPGHIEINEFHVRPTEQAS